MQAQQWCCIRDIGATSAPGWVVQGVLAKLVKSKPAASGEGLPAGDAAELLKSVLFTAARATDKRGAAAAASGFRYLLNVAQGSSQTANPQVRLVPRRPIPIQIPFVLPRKDWSSVACSSRKLYNLDLGHFAGGISVNDDSCLP